MSSASVDLGGLGGGGGGGGGGSVTSVSASGPLSVINPTTTPSISISLADTSTDGYLSSTDWNVFNDKLGPISGFANTFLILGGSGEPVSTSALSLNPNTFGVTASNTAVPDGNSGGFSINSSQSGIEPLQDSPNETWNIFNNQVNLDPASSGFQIGTAGNALNLLNLGISHNGSSDVGGLAFINNYFNLGNGTDPISVKGIAYSYGFGNVNNNATINGPIQGYGFQPNIASGATIDPSTYIIGFYDFANLGSATPGYTSFASGPTISSIANNNGYTGFSNNPTIPTFTGNAGYTGLGIFPTLGTFATGSFNGISVNPNITEANYAVGLNVSMDNVAVFAGVKAGVTVQDLAYEAINVGTDGNNISIQYTPGATAGAEVVSNVGPAIAVQIEDGVSTATQIKAALDAYLTFTQNATVDISGVGSNPQTIVSATNFTGGLNAGTKMAATFDGDVSIDGNLSFTGALSIGQLNSFAPYTVQSNASPGIVSSVDLLITGPNVPASATLTNADLIGVNTAMLLTTGANSTVTTAFLGITALGLPAVVNIGANASVDHVAGATSAISMDAGAGAGGSIDTVDLCNAVAIPNGITSVNKLHAYAFDLPFGDPGTQTWGIYLKPDVNNWIAGSLKVGGTAGSTDVVSNSNVAVEIESTSKALLLSRMTTTQRDAMTAINGMLIYNTTDNKFQGYENGAWVNLV